MLQAVTAKLAPDVAAKVDTIATRDSGLYCSFEFTLQPVIGVAVRVALWGLQVPITSELFFEEIGFHMSFPPPVAGLAITLAYKPHGEDITLRFKSEFEMTATGYVQLNMKGNSDTKAWRNPFGLGE